jgi:hypothetical protein
MTTLPPPSDPPNPPTKPERLIGAEPKLPFSMWWPFLIGTGFGIVLRLVFNGKPGGVYATMGVAFIYLVPMAVGAMTVYVGERIKRQSWSFYFWAPMLSTSLFVIGTLVIMIEGIICAILIIPLFAMLGVVGGLIMALVCRFTMHRDSALYGIALLPLALGLIPEDGYAPQRIAMMERTVTIAAPAERIWHEIHQASDIRADEVESAWMYRIGVPLPLSGMTESTAEGRVRKIRMGKDIHFDQVATEWQENRHVRWTYRFAEDSVPPRALDDHVKIGGHYFDLVDTSYTLEPVDAGNTQLRIRMHYRVSTQFNWYADAIARFLIGNFEEVILDFYQRRAQAA